ncbi:MAG: prolyl oligopeptidase family serine peptidase [Oscillospiraceae bacterium]
MNIVFIVLGIIIILVFIYLFLGFIIERIICHPKKRDYETVKREEFNSKNIINEFQFDLPVEKLQIKNKKGQILIAHYYKNKKPGKYILFNHGYNYPFSSVFKYIYMFENLGYNVLFPDHRNNGGSYNSAITFGFYEKEESFLWANELKKIAKKDNIINPIIGIMGESMGAATSLLMAGDNRGNNFNFCIADCPYSSWKEIIKLRIEEKKIKFFKFLYPSIKFSIKIFDKADIDEVDIIKSAKNIKIPTLIIHGLSDTYVPYDMSKRIAKGNKKIKLFLQKDAKHAQSISTHYDIYLNTVKEFIENNN